MVIIRKATLEDLELVHQIELQSFGDGSYPLFVLRQLFDISAHYFLVAEEDGEIRGYILGNVSSRTREGWILSLGVHPEARGKNIGNTLTKKLISVLENNDAIEICLTVHPDNTSALEIYKALNFEVILSTSNYYFDNADRLLMKKKAITTQINT